MASESELRTFYWRLDNNNISDLSPLKGLASGSNLLLTISNNSVSDLSPLVERRLVWLVADNNEIKDLSPLAKINTLSTLYMSGNQIEDLAPLAGLDGLSTLGLSKNKIQNIEPLSQLKNLQRLYVDRNPIADISTLAELDGLSGVGFDIDSDDDLKLAKSLSGITELRVATPDYVLTDYEIFSRSELTSLSCYDCFDGEPAAFFNALSSNLTGLALDSVTDLSPISSLAIRGLSLRNDKLEDLSPLSDAKTLTNVSVYESNVSDLSFLIGETGPSLFIYESPVLCSHVEEIRDQTTTYIYAPQCLAADKDNDFDGIFDLEDAFPFDPDETIDTDLDGVGNNADTDDDNDGALDIFDAFPLNKAEQLDTDRDGAGNNADTDDDNDGVLDALDDFPVDAKERKDSDKDGVGDNADVFVTNPLEAFDADNDQVGDNADNCPNVSNPNQVNTDRDAEGDACDADDDNDGVSDKQEVLDGTNPLDARLCAGCYSVFDIDADGKVEALTDGLLLVRYLYGFRGNDLVRGVVNTGGERTSAEEIEAYLQSLIP